MGDLARCALLGGQFPRYSMILGALLLVTQGLVVAPGTPISTITMAVDRARDGDTVWVHSGLYREHHIVIDRQLTVLGPSDGSGEAIIDGEGEPILIVRATGVTIQGLTLRNVATSFVDDRAAILLDRAHDCRIIGNTLQDTFFGVYGAKTIGCEIAENTIRGSKRSQTKSGNAIHLWDCRQVAVHDNVVSGHRDGIYLEFARHAVVEHNHSFANHRYGLHFMFSDSSAYTNNHFQANGAGVAVMYGRDVLMVGNRFEHNWGSAAYGVLLKEITDSRIEDNVFDQNTIGLVAEGSNRLQVHDNIFRRNGWAIKVMANATDARFTGNTFLGNSFDVISNGRRTPSVFDRNYWDAYRGYDLDRDGVGDVPFRPVRFFAMLVAQRAPATILLRSFFADLLDIAERVFPILTPETLVDVHPLMQRPSS